MYLDQTTKKGLKFLFSVYDMNILFSDERQAYNLAQVYSNRAACKTKIGDCSGCIEDCSRSLALTPHQLKALMRRAVAYEHLEKYVTPDLHPLNFDLRVSFVTKAATCTRVHACTRLGFFDKRLRSRRVHDPSIEGLPKSKLAKKKQF